MDQELPSTGQLSLVNNGTEAKSTSGRATGRVSKQQWLEMALQVLCSDGVEAVRIVSLARQLNISKSGFYWHFKNRDELLAEMKKYWINEFSQRIISDVQAGDKSPHEKILMLAKMIREKNSGQFDLAFASWAHRDPSVRELVDRVRDLRIAFAKRILADTGCVDSELEARARLMVVYFSWSENMFDQTAGRLEGEPLDDIVKIITSPPAN